MIDEKKLTPESFELSKALSEIHNANTRIEVILNNSAIRFQTKKMLKDWQNKTSSILRDFKMILPTTWKEVFEKELLNDEDSLQLDDIMTMLVKMPKGMRNDVERYAEARYKLFSDNG